MGSFIFQTPMEKQPLLTLLAEHFQCCVCLDMPRPQTALKSCHPGGHLVCEKCFEAIEDEAGDNNNDVKSCPLCRDGLIKDNEKHCSFQNVFDCLSSLFIHPCKNYERGCRYTTTGDKLYAHEDECPISPTMCMKCLYVAPFKKFYNRELLNHQGKCYDIVDNHIGEYSWTVRLYLNEDKMINKNGSFTSQNNIRSKLLRCEGDLNFCLGLILKCKSGTFHALPLWLEKQNLAHKKGINPFLMICVTVNGISINPNEMWVQTKMAYQNDVNDASPICITRKQLFALLVQQRGGCFHCNPIGPLDYIELKIKYMEQIK